MNLMTQPIELSAAYMRAAGHILNTNMKVAQVIMKASVEGNLALANRIKPAAPQAVTSSDPSVAASASPNVAAASMGGDGQSVVAAIEDLKRFVENEIRQLREEVRALRPSA